MQPLDNERPGAFISGSAGSLKDFVTLGRISGLFGIKGWVKVFSDTQPRENITGYSGWWLKAAGNHSGWQEHKVVQARPHGKTIIALLNGVTTREAASKLIGCQVAVPRDLLPQANQGEYYWADLVGCTVTTSAGIELGMVARLFETGANDVLVVKTGTVNVPASYQSEILIPWVVPEVITSIDLATKQIVVDWDPDY